MGEKYYWKEGSNGAIPHAAWIAGYDKGLVYVARTYVNGELTPGKVIPSLGHAYFPYHGEERIIDDYEVLCLGDEGPRLQWYTIGNGIFNPYPSIIGGNAKNGDNYLICRVSENNIGIIGKVF
jgi:hypothetical protein